MPREEFLAFLEYLVQQEWTGSMTMLVENKRFRVERWYSAENNHFEYNITDVVSRARHQQYDDDVHSIFMFVCSML
jgi:Tfp pilus assembly protein PilE